METIYNWTATRSGARITVCGQAEDGSPRRVVGVDSIHTNGGVVFAQRSVQAGAHRWLLSPDPLPAASHA